MAAIAARRGGGAGLATEGMQTSPDTPERGVARLILMNPAALLKLLYVMFYPLRFVLWALVPLLALAGMTLFQNWADLARDMGLLLADFSRLATLIVSLFTVNLVSRLAQGVAVTAWGGRVQALGLTLMLGVVPRFFIDQSAIAGLERRGQLWAHAAPLLARLGLFVAGVMLWAIQRDSGSMMAQYALLVGQFGLITFVLTALPLIPGDGMRWIATYLNEPRLLPKTALVLRHVLTGAPLPPIVGRADIVPLVVYGMGMVLTVTALALTFLIYVGLTLETELGGVGVILFLGVLAAFVTWLLALRLSIVRRAADRRAALRGGEGGLGQQLMAQLADGQAASTDPVARTSGAARVIWGLVMAGLLAVAFLPYDYEAGGPVEILPLARGQAVARSDGEVLQVMVAEGEVVAPGQVVAQLSAWNQSREVAVTQAQLSAAQANLARLQAGPKAEQIELARRELARAESSLSFSQAEALRTRDLAESGTVSRQALDEANAAYETDLAGLEVARANLALVESGATPEELAVAAAEVERLEVELAFREDELARTRITAPMAGRVITADLDLRHGSFLREGETLLEIEDAAIVNAVIAIPESDIALVVPGDEVRLKVWGQYGEIAGLVQSIAPAAEEEGYGSVVRVTASFPNPAALLRSGMTGYAKVDGAPMRVWDAYMRRIVRFFEVEVWSWIP
jgi:multidrug resistance efflux pump